MQKITILGHTNQDTDATCAAIALEELFNKAGIYKAKAKITDTPNRETKFVFEKLGIKKPGKFKPQAKEVVFLVDFNEESQSPLPFKKAQLEGLVDHHKLEIRISKDYPIIFRVEPVGSSSTIVYKMYKDYGVEITKTIASLLLCGIVSDTLNLSSPTTTEEDKKIAKELAIISKEDVSRLADEMFFAKSNLKGISPKNIITTDYKEFKFGKQKTGIGVLETVNLSGAQKMEREIRKALSELKKKKELDLIFFALVDIIKSNASLILIGKEEEDAARKAFGSDKQISDGIMHLPGVVSRKKQMVPNFMKKIK